MNKLIIAIMVLTTTSCEYHEPPVTTYVDPETKCEYLVNVHGGITPRVAANGLQYGCTYDYEVSQ